MKRRLSSVLAYGFVLLSTCVQAVRLDDLQEPLSGESFTASPFRLWYSDNLASSIRGVYFWIEPQAKDSRDNMASDVALQDLCAEHDFALLGAKLYEVGMETGIGNAVLWSLQVFAQQSGHPELEYAPLYLEGYSWGGQFGYHFTIWKPSRVIGFVTMKGGYHRAGSAGQAIYVPGFLFIGDRDLDYRQENLPSIFAAYRPLGARWALYVHPGTGHARVTDRTLLDPVFHTTINQRLPQGPLPNDEPPTLLVNPEDSGWLGQQETLVIGSWDCYQADPDTSSWLSTQELAQDWQAFNSRSTVTDIMSCPASTDAPLTLSPTSSPSVAFTSSPTHFSTSSPTLLPTSGSPTTEIPTSAPTMSSTNAPMASTSSPTLAPTSLPTESPTDEANACIADGQACKNRHDCCSAWCVRVRGGGGKVCAA